MRRDEVLAILTAHQDEIRAFGVRSLSLFGSVARDEAGPESDIDLLVEFDRPTGLFGLIRLKNFLSELLGRPVDLVTPDGLSDHVRDDALREAIRAA
ncbi:nucleotidyltransferase family protein [Sphaerobacter thermophilus]|jgi:Predicted nucleotidyltransferases|uniref:DNA polymerase beta domain protein region n=1 Tax=Sphaerobacter thermophilus (strain ATCC 49802 / DSM 20745 / KCCM 41009 / NCIMB 13125 / S 6022) TaxID=479434 RepID=D1C7D6_SPHTD|nr:nucleotidyltransferase family protein [Sphaerobacter thermophilus]ACZ39782.1 DNA polymerase beta domain protein region [Sphaerobacter thermophilus DSM 20745]PZN61581.1 MAG: nucleotidyltransferase [Sphaerobacter thermophilus]